MKNQPDSIMSNAGRIKKVGPMPLDRGVRGVERLIGG